MEMPPRVTYIQLWGKTADQHSIYMYIVIGRGKVFIYYILSTYMYSTCIICMGPIFTSAFAVSINRMV